MKKRILAIPATVLAITAAVFAFHGTSSAGMKYECWTYKNGKPDKYTYVVADNKGDAESKAPAKFRNLGATWDYIKCK